MERLKSEDQLNDVAPNFDVFGRGWTTLVDRWMKANSILTVSQRFWGTREHWQNNEGNKGIWANFWEQGNKIRKITVRKHSENVWEHGNIGQFWKDEQGNKDPPWETLYLVLVKPSTHLFQWSEIRLGLLLRRSVEWKFLPDLQKPFASEMFVKLSKTVRANDSHNLQGLCKTPTGWLRMADGGWKNADTKI